MKVPETLVRFANNPVAPVIVPPEIPVKIPLVKVPEIPLNVLPVIEAPLK